MNRGERRSAQRRQRLARPGQRGAPQGRPPPDTSVLLEAARSRHGAGRLSEAAELYRRLLAGDPQNAEALLQFGAVEFQLGRLAQAFALVERSIALRPEHPFGWLLLSTLMIAGENLAGAAAACQSALALAPGLAAAHAGQGDVWAASEKFDLAAAAYRQAVTLEPKYVEAWINLGTALFRQGRIEEAVAAHRQALSLRPDHAHAYRNLATAWRELGRLDLALAAYRRATELAPDFAEAHRDEALLLLLLGRYEEGWAKYEWRWRANERGARLAEGRRWMGENIEGRTILLQSEQGAGDTIQFLRYVPLVAGRGGRVVVDLPNSLLRLVQTGLSGVAEVRDRDLPPPQFDCCAPLLSLPHIFGTTMGTIPAAIPYLHAPASYVEEWRGDFAGLRRPLVGLAWAGNPDQENDRNRSIEFERLKPLIDAGSAQFVSLQVGARSADPASSGVTSMVELPARLTDFCETAGAIMNLDLVITVCTSVAHLAGALGKPVWLLLPFVPSWRWLLARDDSSWYPTMRLFRQKTSGAWDEVIAQVGRELAAFAAPRQN